MNLTDSLKIELKKYKDLRYGENPHQKSAFYLEDPKNPGYHQFWGMELSHNNLGDANGAWKLVCEFEEPTVAIIKHMNPSGIASKKDLAYAFRLAFEADKISAFGGIIAVNREPTLEMIESMRGIFFELIVAPGFSKEVLDRFKKRSQKMRIIKASKSKPQLSFTRAFSGYLVQSPDNIVESREKWQVVTGKIPTKKIYEDLEFAWRVVKHVKSNAIVIARDKNQIGMGTGQTNRVNSVMLALKQAGKRAKGAVLASDAFFPFADNVEVAAKAGISVIIQPGGSVNDEQVIKEAKKHRITMVFTGVRHFKH